MENCTSVSSGDPSAPPDASGVSMSTAAKAGTAPRKQASAASRSRRAGGFTARRYSAAKRHSTARAHPVARSMAEYDAVLGAYAGLARCALRVTLSTAPSASPCDSSCGSACQARGDRTRDANPVQRGADDSARVSCALAARIGDRCRGRLLASAIAGGHNAQRRTFGIVRCFFLRVRSPRSNLTMTRSTIRDSVRRSEAR